MSVPFGACSISTTNAYLGFSYGKNPVTQEWTNALLFPTSAVPVFAAISRFLKNSPCAVPLVTDYRMPRCTIANDSFVIFIISFGAFPCMLIIVGRYIVPLLAYAAIARNAWSGVI